MWCETSDEGPALGIHLGMAGRIVVDGDEAGDPRPRVDRERWDRFTIDFRGWRAPSPCATAGASGACASSPRSMPLGPDAAEITRAAFRERVSRSRMPVKARIMDQKVLAGVGNLLADEALWQARIDPRRPANGLEEAELDRLRNAIRAANRKAIAGGGVHTGKVIPARRRDGVCPRCGTPMERATVGGRTTYWCPAEQH